MVSPRTNYTLNQVIEMLIGYSEWYRNEEAKLPYSNAIVIESEKKKWRERMVEEKSRLLHSLVGKGIDLPFTVTQIDKNAVHLAYRQQYGFLKRTNAQLWGDDRLGYCESRIVWEVGEDIALSEARMLRGGEVRKLTIQIEEVVHDKHKNEHTGECEFWSIHWSYTSPTGAIQYGKPGGSAGCATLVVLALCLSAGLNGEGLAKVVQSVFLL